MRDDEFRAAVWFAVAACMGVLALAGWLAYEVWR